MTWWLDATVLPDFALGEQPIVQGVTGFATAAFKYLVGSLLDELQGEAIAMSASIVSVVHDFYRLVTFIYFQELDSALHR